MIELNHVSPLSVNYDNLSHVTESHSWELKEKYECDIMDDMGSRLPAGVFYMCSLSLLLLNPKVSFHLLINFFWAHPIL